MKHIFNALNYHQIGRLQESFMKQQTLDRRTHVTPNKAHIAAIAIAIAVAL